MKYLYFSLILACVMSIGIAVKADTTTANLSVSATVADTCTLSAITALQFGTIDETTTSDETTAGELQILCTGAHAGVTVTMDGGTNESGGTRYMSDGGSATVPYAIHSDSGHTSAISSGGTIFTGNVSANVVEAIPVYGQVPSGTYDAGSYTDTITATLTY